MPTIIGVEKLPVNRLFMKKNIAAYVINTSPVNAIWSLNQICEEYSLSSSKFYIELILDLWRHLIVGVVHELTLSFIFHSFQT